jgi:hypothetical protein
MKKILVFLLAFARGRLRGASSFHNDSLRANQGGQRAAFSPWRSLIGG